MLYKIISAILLSLISNLMVQAQKPGNTDPEVRQTSKCCLEDGTCADLSREQCIIQKGIVLETCEDCPGIWGVDRLKK
jgi:hypothetical protein